MDLFLYWIDNFTCNIFTDAYLSVLGAGTGWKVLGEHTEQIVLGVGIGGRGAYVLCGGLKLLVLGGGCGLRVLTDGGGRGAACRRGLGIVRIGGGDGGGGFACL